MLHIYSSTLHTDQLLAQIRQRCTQAPTVPALPASPPAAPVIERSASLPVRAWRAFRASGYSWRWVARQIPGVLPAYLFVHTLLDLRQTLHMLQENQSNAQKNGKLQHRHIEKRLQQLHYQQDKLQRENTQLRKRLLRAEKLAQHSTAAAHAPGQHLSAAERTCEALSHWYSAFEEAQRGHAEHIAQRQAHYLPLVTPALHALPQAPTLDLGCGRGEWVQLLAQLGHPAQGVDSNADMLHPADAAGAHVICQDIFTFLAAQPSAHYALVTSFQVVEHLPLEQLLQLLQQAWRVLLPGGMLILETPNPENLQVAAYSFWMDPTHQRPLPPPLLLHMAQHTGFQDCHIHRSSPWPAAQQAPSLPDPLPKLLYADQDYALIARKPHAPPAP